jgi:hypothetical protein
MKSMMVTRAQRQLLETLSKRDLAALRKNPNLLSGSKHLLVAVKKVIRKLEAIPRSAGHKRRDTAYKRIILMCEKAIEKAEH